jgi:hypothetical protein
VWKTLCALPYDHRDPPGSTRTAWAVAQVHRNIQEFGNVQRVMDDLKDQKYSELPAILGLAAGSTMPVDGRFGAVVTNNNDGTMDVIKIITFDRPAKIGEATALFDGDVMVPVWRDGPWAVKKAFQVLKERIEGHHVSWASVTAKAVVQRTRSSNWEVSDDEIEAGAAFIRAECPTTEDESEMTKWVWKKINPKSDSPIAGWPEQKALRIALNKKKASQGVPTHTFFPLTVFSLHPLWYQLLLPLMMPLFTECGMLLLGMPGIGKTPLICIIATAMGRTLVRGGRADKAGWRRGKEWDDFKDRTSLAGIAAFLDDPGLISIALADMKNFLCVAEYGSSRARYNNPVWLQNQFRACADNEFDINSEPPDDNRTQIGKDEFLQMMVKPFAGQAVTHIFAALKRCVTCIPGKHGLHIRLPSQDDDAIVHRISDAAIRFDWLTPKDKPFYGKFLNNVHETPPNFYEDITAEAKLVDDSFAVKARHDITEDYIKACNELLQKKLIEMREAEVPGPRPVHDEHVSGDQKKDLSKRGTNFVIKVADFCYILALGSRNTHPSKYGTCGPPGPEKIYPRKDGS